MTYIDLNKPENMAKAIASGIVWSLPRKVQDDAIKLIAEEKVPVPAYLSNYAREGVKVLNPNLPLTKMNEGSGPV